MRVPELSPLLALTALVGLVLALLARRLLGSIARGYEARAPFVIDGDTLVADRVRIRLHGIDAPELSQAGGEAARAHLIRLIGDCPVWIEPLGTDLYERRVARVHGPAGDLGRRMVRDGYARAAYGTDYAAEERAARADRAGLWAGPGIASPAAHRARSNRDRGRTRWT
jgi:endonuclease YncB( thermonuclease family)